MKNDFTKRYFVFRLASAQILLESDAKLLPPKVGAVIRLPSHSNEQEIMPYRIKAIQVTPKIQDKVTIYIEVEPA